MVRNVLGSLLALAGAASAVYSPYRDWYGDREGRHYRVADLFGGGGITAERPELYLSLLLPFAAAALVTLAGIALRLRWPVAVAGVAVVGFTVLWLVREAQVRDSLTVNGDGTAVDIGTAFALGGGIALLLAAVVMSGGGPARVRSTAAGAEESEGDYGSFGPPEFGPGPRAGAPGRLPDPYRTGGTENTGSTGNSDTATLPTMERPGGHGESDPPAWHRRPSQ
ncbi:hypothetical protein [Streptomyces sp. NPDC050560]|uniref:hypothetical protein n=1 Tax=Streptomyces sp. NPDC050560 TaxID=3365630 RepID=UPI00378C904A